MPLDSSAPENCRDCGVEYVRENPWQKRRCVDCKLRAARESQARTRARRRGAIIPARRRGFAPVAYPFPCKVCGVAIKTADERGGLTLCCKSCRREQHRAAELRRLYGLSASEWALMWWEAGGKCACCGDDPDGSGPGGGLVVDHDHDTGRVRALLCTYCNSAIGWGKESPARLRAAADYLEAYGNGLLAPDRSPARSRAVA